MSDRVKIVPVSTSFLGSTGVDLEHYERLFNTSSSLIAIATFDGYFEHLNPSWKALLGYGNEELCSHPFTEFIHPEDVGATVTEVGRMSAGGCQVVDFNNRYRCKDGSDRWLAWHATADAETKRFYCVDIDMTERVLAEEELQQAKEAAERAQRSLEQGNADLEQAIARANTTHWRSGCGESP